MQTERNALCSPIRRSRLDILPAVVIHGKHKIRFCFRVLKYFSTFRCRFVCSFCMVDLFRFFINIFYFQRVLISKTLIFPQNLIKLINERLSNYETPRWISIKPLFSAIWRFFSLSNENKRRCFFACFFAHRIIDIIYCWISLATV